MHAAVIAAAWLAGCGRAVPPTHAVPLPITVRADLARGGRLEVSPPPQARVWMSRVSPAAPREVALPAPDATPDIVPEEMPRPMPPDPSLQAPLLRSTPELIVPASAGHASLELEVRVNEHGDVDEARWAAGDPGSALIAAARRCALGMRFYPARRGGRAVVVWCRQRFDFGVR
ncbi:MAG: hypothetical protein HYR73_06060 [Candidatus Eisenbacteria bacterium]|nr:hypothetical protein [Candidatus Eisenbacteria bacterium]